MSSRPTRFQSPEPPRSRLIIAGLMLTAVGACGPRGPEPSVSAKAAEHVPKRVISQVFNLRGTEPFWAIEIRPKSLIYRRMDAQPLTASHPGVVRIDGQLTWSTTAGGKAVKVALRHVGDCSDGMSDLVYPYAAEVVIGSEVPRGCAYDPANEPEGMR